MVPFPLFLAARYLRPKRSFSSVIPFVTVLGITLGVAILMIVLAVMTGFGDVWRDRILSFSPHVVVQGRYGDIRDAEETYKYSRWKEKKKVDLHGLKLEEAEDEFMKM